MRTDCSAPGNNDTTGGSATDQGPASPSTWTVNWSTTVPLLRIRISAVACAPGATAIERVRRFANRTHSRGV